MNTDTAAEIVEQITRTVEPILQESAIELVDIEFRPSGKRWLLRIYIDKEGGVSIADCERASKEMSRLLDVENIIDHPYVLEVSSPGLTRRLRKKADFERGKGKMCRIVTRSEVDGKNEFRGEIIFVAEDEVEVREERGIHRIPLSVITKANLEFEL
ncbi:MAG: ribosome maturation factor RimP [Syntrophorhabdales bacterium]